MGGMPGRGGPGIDVGGPGGMEGGWPPMVEGGGPLRLL